MMKPALIQITSLLFFICLINKASAQIHPNNIEIDSIRITTKDRKELVPMHSSQAKLIKAFGKPKNIEKYYFETDEKNGFKVSYPGANFYFIDDQLIGFDYEGMSKFQVGVLGQNIYTTVGGSCMQFKNIKSSAKGGFFNVQKDGLDCDELLSFENYKDSGLIWRIIYTSYDANQDNYLKAEDFPLLFKKGKDGAP